MGKKTNQQTGAKTISIDGVELNSHITGIKKASPTTKAALLLGIIAFCIYANTLGNGYAGDDANSIQQNTLVSKGIAAIPEILLTPYHRGNYIIKDGSPTDDLYRPLSLVMFAIEHQLFPNNPMVGHFINILLYAGCVMLFFLFLHYLFKKQRPAMAFAAALLFALHPVHTEVVANIKSRDELLCFFFGFLSLNFLTKYIENNKSRLLVYGLSCYFLSLLSKETSITFIAVIPLIFLFYRNENRKRSISVSLFALVPLLLYLGIRFAILLHFHDFNPSAIPFYENALVAAPSAASRIATEILILGRYIKLLVIPYPLVSDYSIPFTNFGNIWVWLSLIACGLLVYFGVSGLIKKRYNPLVFAILFFLITISVFSNILFLIGSEMSERFMFFPSAGYCIAITFIIEQLVLKGVTGEIGNMKNKKFLFILIPISLVFIWITVNRNSEWKDNYTLIETDIKKYPDNCRLYCNAASEEMAIANGPDAERETRQKMFVKGIRDYQKCLAINEDFKPAQVNLAVVFIGAKIFDSAAAHAQKAFSISPDDPNVMNILAIVYFNQQKYPESIDLDKSATAADPTNSYYPGNIGVCDLRMKQYDSAIYYFRRSIGIDYADFRYVKFLAGTYNTTGQRDSALNYEAIARQSDSRFSVDGDNGFK